MKAVAVFLLALSSLAVSDAWNCAEAPRLYNAFQIDAGLGIVVARDRNYYPYFLIGSSWYRMSSTRFKYVSAGPAGIWGAGINSRVYKYVTGIFRMSSGINVNQVDAGGNHQVVAVNTNLYAYCLRSPSALAYSGVGNLGWTSLSRRMRHISCSPQNRCWGIDLNYRIYYTSINPQACRASAWRAVPGALKMVEVATDGNVFGVTRAGTVFQRIGISSRAPYGVRWVHIPMCMPIRDVTYDLGMLWVVTNSGLVLRCTQ